MVFTNGISIALRTVCLVIVLNLYETESASAAYSQLISSLYQRAVNENRPLVLVLDNSGTSRGQHQHSHDHVESHNHLNNRPKLRSQDLQTPLVKGLLALRNSLSCAAQDECADDCKPNKKQDDCVEKCVVQYNCDPEPKDKCDDEDCGSRDACDESNDCDDKEISTKGELWSQETVKCKRC